MLTVGVDLVAEPTNTAVARIRWTESSAEAQASYLTDSPGGLIRRAVVVGDTLWTVSNAGAKAVSGTDLSSQSWVPFT